MGFNPLNYIAKRTGESMEELRDRMSAGKIGVDEVKQAFVDATSEGGQFFNGMEEGSKTFAGRIATLKDNFNELLGNATKPLFNYLSQTALPQAINLVGLLNSNLDKIGIVLGGLTAAFTAAFAISKVKSMTTLMALLTGQINVATIATTAWGKAMQFVSANKFILIASAIVGVGTALGIASKNAGGFSNLIANISAKFDEIIPKITEKLPEFLNVGFQILQNIINGISENLPSLINAAVNILNQLTTFIVQNIPIIVQTGLRLILGLVQGIVNNLPQIISAGLKLVTSLVTGILQNLPQIASTALKLIVQIATTIVQSLPQIISSGGQIIKALWNGIKSLTAWFLESLWSFIKSIPSRIVQIVSSIKSSGGQIIKGLWSGISGLVSWFLGKVWSFAKSIPSKIVEGIGNVASIGKDLVKGLWNGIKSLGGWLGGKIKGFFGGIKDKIKGFFGINSPSKWMRDMIGKNLVLGMAVGIDKNAQKAVNSVKNLTDKVKSASAVSVSGRGGYVGTSSRTITNNNQVVQNFYNKQTTPYEAYRKAGAAFAY